jgi:DNA-binding FadR family transcriptional regulator
MSDLYEFRKILEINSARLAASNAQPAHLREFERILLMSEKLSTGRKDRAKTVELDLQIHDLIARASGNVSLHEASRSLMDKIKCFIWVDWMGAASVADPASIAAAHRDHQALIQRIIERDEEGAVRIMDAHIDKARHGLEKMLKERSEFQSVVLAAN